jgi:hypothetical protein
MSRQVQRLASLVAVALTVAACSAEPDQAVRRDQAAQPDQAIQPDQTPAATAPEQVTKAKPTPASSCQDTVPMDAAAVPPVVARAGAGWYGKGDLWVSMSSARPAPANFARIDGSYRLKYATVTLDNGKPSPRFGPPAVQVMRLDRTGTATVDFGGYGTTSTLQFWPTTIDFSDPGCWLVTSSLQQTVVRFVVEVL